MPSDTGGGQANERTAEMGNYIPWPWRMWGRISRNRSRRQDKKELLLLVISQGSSRRRSSFERVFEGGRKKPVVMAPFTVIQSSVPFCSKPPPFIPSQRYNVEGERGNSHLSYWRKSCRRILSTKLLIYISIHITSFCNSSS